MYEFMFEWLRNASKEERHCQEIEDFAKRHPIEFMKFHQKSKSIVNDDINSEKYLKAKEELNKLFSEHEEDFLQVFEAVKRMSSK